MTTEQKILLCVQLHAELESRGVVNTSLRFVDLETFSQEEEYWSPKIRATTIIDGITIEYAAIGEDEDTAEVVVYVHEPETQKPKLRALKWGIEEMKAEDKPEQQSHINTRKHENSAKVFEPKITKTLHSITRKDGHLKKGYRKVNNKYYKSVLYAGVLRWVPITVINPDEVNGRR